MKDLKDSCKRCSQQDERDQAPSTLAFLTLVLGTAVSAYLLLVLVMACC